VRRISLLLVVLVSCTASSPEAPSPSAGTQIVIRSGAGEVRVDVEVADDESEREVGLMDRESLPEDRGMAFIWQDPIRASFWMKDTLIPLSIAFWDEGGSIVAILDMDPCPGDPCPTYDPGVEFVGALEVNLGYFDDHGVRVGDEVDYEGFR
jgi:hypothetical protein